MQQNKKQRLDEILISQGLAAESQVKEALLRQKVNGGKFGSQLMCLRYIDEAGLVKALAYQFGCEGVILSDLKISEKVVKMIPVKVARSRKVVPFDFDVKLNLLKVACENPNDQNLARELNFASGKEIKLYVAAEIALNTAINNYYLGYKTTLEDSLLLEIPDDLTETGKISLDTEEESDEKTADSRLSVLLVSDEVYSTPLLQSLLERDNYVVDVLDSADGAIELFKSHKYHIVFIKDTILNDANNLIDRIRKISPGTLVNNFRTISSLLFNKDIITKNSELVIENLELFTSLLSANAKLSYNHSGRVGNFTDKLCRKLSLPTRDRLAIVDAAYIHDIARFYYGNETASDNRQIIELTTKLLSSLNYPSLIVEILRSMYQSLDDKYNDSLPIEILGGNIITIVDLFCEAIPQNEQLTLDKFDAIKKKFRDMSGKLFLADVVEAFVEMVQEEMLNLQTTSKTMQVMIYIEDQTHLQPLELRLNNEGFRTVSQSNISSFIELYKRSEPDLIILVIEGEPNHIKSFIDELTNGGIGFERIPAFLLVNNSYIPKLTNLLEQGIEDIIAFDDNLDILVSKIKKIQTKIATSAKDNAENDDISGARGRLADMSLIDLIQALGPALKTVKITVKPNKPDAKPLVMYLNKGNISYAELDNLAGAEAIYKALTWADGTWVIEPATTEELPKPNNQLSNDSILMEGCYQMDEKLKSGQLL